MKRFLISSTFFSILILTSCGSTPTATSATSVPSETSSPTPTETSIPTPSPESLLPQEVQDKFETAGIDLKDMQNAKYDKNGLSITLESGEVVLLTNEELKKNIFLGQDNVLQYRDESNQNVIYAYDKESGKWMQTIDSATIALFDKYGIDLSTITLAEVNGVVVGTDKETGKEIFRDGRFEISYAVELAKKDCEPTDFMPDKSGFVRREYYDSYEEYIIKILEDFNYPSSLNDWGTIDVLIDREKQCWAVVDSSRFYYRDESDLAHAVPIIHLTVNEAVAFSFGRE